MIQLDIWSWSLTKKSNSNSQCCYESGSTQKPPTLYDSSSDSASLADSEVRTVRMPQVWTFRL